MKNFWVSWYADEDDSFELNFPWWISGYVVGYKEHTICAAIKAESEHDVVRIVKEAYDYPSSVRFRFIDERPNGWSPFIDRFPKEEWMEW